MSAATLRRSSPHRVWSHTGIRSRSACPARSRQVAAAPSKRPVTLPFLRTPSVRVFSVCVPSLRTPPRAPATSFRALPPSPAPAGRPASRLQVGGGPVPGSLPCATDPGFRRVRRARRSRRRAPPHVGGAPPPARGDACAVLGRRSGASGGCGAGRRRPGHGPGRWWR
ncbi:hypothetical protein LV779_28445 [Streptomyces thinghirensis]|nr:hypothetical protein [Streptomyces thinghirensis]